MASRWRLVSLTIVVAAVSIGALRLFDRPGETAVDPSNKDLLVNQSAAVQASTRIPATPSRPGTEQAPEAPPDAAASPSSADVISTGPPQVVTERASDPEPEMEAPIDSLLYQAIKHLPRGANQDLLRFILEEEIRESGADLEAAVAFEAAVLDVAAARGMPAGIQSGISEIVCSVSLCSFKADLDGTYNTIRHTPEWSAMEEQGPVPSIDSVLGPSQSWVGFGLPERRLQVYYYRPAIERHRELLEAVLAEP